MRTIGILLSFCLVVAACSKQETPASEKKEEAKPAEEAKPSPEDAVAATPDVVEEPATPDVAEAPPVEAPPPARLWPTTLDVSVAIKPSQLEAAFEPFNEKEIVVAGHPMFFFDEDSLKGRVGLNIDATNKDTKSRLVECTMKADDEEKFSKTKVVVLKGKAEGYNNNWKHFVIKDCEKVAILDAMPARVENVDPDKADPAAPIPADQLMELVSWADKEVLLVGSFNGQTTSTTTYGVSHRIDMYDAGADMFSGNVSVYLKEKAGDEHMGSSKVWKVKGKLSGGTSFRRPEVVEAEFVEKVSD
ncbi:MAG: hypothetical protein RBU37_23315 [Myxococcota bacterium]|jgi:hypothetical protein|nr:hypothetical protein [Myxococcota bacterium]